MKIRVLRLLEYTYDSVEVMERDMKRWNIPQTGTYVIPSAGIEIASSVLPLNILEDEGA